MSGEASRAMRAEIERGRQVFLDDLREKAKDPLRYPGAAGYLNLVEQVIHFLTAKDAGHTAYAEYHEAQLRRMVLTPPPAPPDPTEPMPEPSHERA